MTDAHEEAQELMKDSSEYVARQNFSAREIENLRNGKPEYREVNTEEQNAPVRI